jgi:hypothetical protein
MIRARPWSGGGVTGQVFRVVLDDELAASAAPLADALWAVLDAWPPTLQRRFVRFVTGTERLPLAGTELMRVELPFVAVNTKDHQRHLQMLPQASRQCLLPLA